MKSNKYRRYCAFQFILGYDSEAVTPIYINRCRTMQLRQIHVCNYIVEEKGAALWHCV